MTPESENHLRLEIGHVLFIDIVGYSKLLITEQSEQIQELKRIVRGTDQFRVAEAEGKLLRLPTGDGVALVFRNSPEAPVLCAMEIAKALKNHPKLRVRMGIHSGPVNEISDLNEQANIAGAGINIAQRVMDCADAGHILLSKHVADDLEHYPRWQPYLHSLGECEVKHGIRIGIVNLYRDDVGNAQVPKKFRSLRKRRAGMRWGIAAAASLLLAATFLSFILISRRPAQFVANVAEKSLAVLPLVNTGGDPNNEYFSDGLSEELIAVLAKLPTLKVIGRSSSFLFKGTGEDSRTIGKKLGVENLLEGTVRKQGDRVRIVAELVSAADGRELWTETYERDLKDVFAVQTEIAKAVTSQLKIKLLGLPPQSDAAPFSENVAAYTALQQGDFYFSRGNEENLRKGMEFYNEAIRLDPFYGLAYASLSGAWQSVAQGLARTPDEVATAYDKARSAAQTALSLQPGIPEAHTAMGDVLLFADHNYDEAATQYRQAEALAPSDVGPKYALMYLLFAQARLQEAEDMCRKYLALEPLVTGASLSLGRILVARGRYDEAERTLRRGAELFPKSARWHMWITFIYLLKDKSAAALEEARREQPGFWQDYALALAQQAQGDRAAADASLQKFIEKHAGQGAFQVAMIYALRKQPDQMFTWLERAYEGNDAGLTQLLTSPFIRNYSGDPRFAALCQKLKLPLPHQTGN